MNLRRVFCVGVGLLLVLNLGFLSTASGEETFFDWPVKDKVAIHYHQKYSNIENGKEYTHHGIDIQTPAGTEVVAASDGKVSFTGFTPAGGGTVSIVHPNGYKTTYLQLAQISVSKGEELKRGQTIATIAASGDRSFDKPHLHFGVKEIATDKYVDPELLLPAVSSNISSSNSEISESLATGSVSSSAPHSLVADNSLVMDNNLASQLLRQTVSSPALSPSTTLRVNSVEGPISSLYSGQALSEVEEFVLEQEAISQPSEVKLLNESGADLKYKEPLLDLDAAAFFGEKPGIRTSFSEDRSSSFSEDRSSSFSKDGLVRSREELLSASGSNSGDSLKQRGEKLLPLGSYQLPSSLVGSSSGFDRGKFSPELLSFSRHNGCSYPLPGKRALEISLYFVAFLLTVVLAGLIIRRISNLRSPITDVCTSTANPIAELGRCKVEVL